MKGWEEYWSETVAIEDLTIPMVKSFVSSVNQFAADLVSWAGAKRSADGSELVIFELRTDAPQRPHTDIRLTETMSVCFRLDNSPTVFALRDNFPDTEHQQLVPEGWPSALCLDERPWVEARITWTAAELLQRLSLWLHRAARGELHDINQPLDPIFFFSPYVFIVPRASLSDQGSTELVFMAKQPNTTTFVSMPLEVWGRQPAASAILFMTLALRVKPERMARLRRAPTNVLSLVNILQERGIDLVDDLRARIKGWEVTKKEFERRLNSKLAIIVEFPVVSPRTGVVEGTDTRAFVPTCTLGELGTALGILHRADPGQGTRSGYARAIPTIAPNNDTLKTIEVLNAHAQIEFDQARAAELAGHKLDTRRVALVGAGAIGSLTSTILAREGRYWWLLIDSDLLLPHNLARHSLDVEAVGAAKSLALAGQINSLRPPSAPGEAAGLVCDVLSPGTAEQDLSATLETADVIVDASASVAVSRYLSDQTVRARRASIFFNPSGDSVVVLVEPKDRSITLRDLEAQYFRAVLSEIALDGHLRAAEQMAYSGACRAVTNRIPHHRATLLSSIAAGALEQALDQPEGIVGIWTANRDLAVSVVRFTPAATETHELNGWRVTIDHDLTGNLHVMRASKLPVETGGILLGLVDVSARSIHIAAALSPPHDSVEEEVGFERGVAGVEASIARAGKKTMDQIRYVGEWHSHPPKASTMPSIIDFGQLAWLAELLMVEQRPGLMLIVGDTSVRINCVMPYQNE